MARAFAELLDDLAPPLRDWMFLGAGVVILSLATLLPASLENQKLAHDREVLRRQAQALAQRRHDYQRFADTLAGDDPVLLQRLAFHYLRLKPAGTTPVFGLTPGSHPACQPQTVDHWLDQPIPAVGAGLPPFSPARSRLTRALSSVPQQWAATGLGVLLISLALIPHKPRH